MLNLSKKMLAKARRSSRDALYGLHGRLHDTVTIQTKQGRLTFSTRDVGIGAPLFRERHYEFHSSVRCINFLKEKGFIQQSGVCMLDVGANIGLISTGLLLANEVEYAIAIEPEPGNYEFLSQNVQQNGLSRRMCCLRMAVGDQPAKLTMEISANNPGDHRIRRSPAAGAKERLGESQRKSIEIPSLPLSQILKSEDVKKTGLPIPTLLWIDVQGYEGYVFQGGREFLNHTPAVSEVWPYGILRAGMSLEEYRNIVSGIWTDYWVFRRQRFVRYPISVFDRFLDELGVDGNHENVIFTNSVSGG